MSRSRFFLAPDAWGEGSAVLDEVESHHAKKVLRFEVGEEIVVFDGIGREALATIAAAGKQVAIDLQESRVTPRSRAEIVLVQAIPKGKSMDTIIQKSTELGANGIIPLLTDHTVVKLDARDAKKRAEKWRKVALEAAKQCGQNWIPEVRVPTTLTSLFEAEEKADALWMVASLEAGARPLKQILGDEESTPAKVFVLVGPEGDFSQSEYALAAEAGCHAMDLGSIVLRAETAGVHCVSILGHELF